MACGVFAIQRARAPLLPRRGRNSGTPARARTAAPARAAVRVVPRGASAPWRTAIRTRLGVAAVLSPRSAKMDMDPEAQRQEQVSH